MKENLIELLESTNDGTKYDEVQEAVVLAMLEKPEPLTQLAADAIYPMYKSEQYSVLIYCCNKLPKRLMIELFTALINIDG